jgi:hypothetical protein
LPNRSGALSSTLGTPEPCLRKSRGLGQSPSCHPQILPRNHDFFEDGRDDYDCRKVSKKLFKTVFDEFFDAAMHKRGLIEQQVNAQENDHDLDLSEDLTDALDDIVERLFSIKPDLRKRA